MHDLVRPERDDLIVRSVQLLAEDAGTERVGIEPDHEVQEGRPVRSFDDLTVMVSAVDFFRQIKGLILALVKAQTRIRFEIFKGERLSARERVALCEEDVCAASEEFSEIQIVLVEDLHENIPVEIVQI